MIKVILAVILLFVSTPSFAEDYEEKIIYEDKAWKVATWEYDESSISCAAGLLEDEKEFFIEINVHEKYSIFGFWYDDTNINKNLKRIFFSIDNNEGWYSSTPEIEDGSIYFYYEDADESRYIAVIEQIKAGKTIFHWDDDNKLIDKFDLSGAPSSMEILDKCVTYIAGL